MSQGDYGCYSRSKEYGMEYKPYCTCPKPSPVISIEGYKKKGFQNRGWGCGCYSTNQSYGSGFRDMYTSIYHCNSPKCCCERGLGIL